MITTRLLDPVLEYWKHTIAAEFSCQERQNWNSDDNGDHAFERIGPSPPCHDDKLHDYDQNSSIEEFEQTKVLKRTFNQQNILPEDVGLIATLGVICETK
jgi:hypothetical protein